MRLGCLPKGLPSAAVDFLLAKPTAVDILCGLASLPAKYFLFTLAKAQSRKEIVVHQKKIPPCPLKRGN